MMKMTRALAVAAAAVFAVACAGNPEQLKQEYLASGNAYAADKKIDEAIIQYRSAIQQDPRFGEARKQLAVAYIAKGDGMNALREAVRAADLLPTDIDAQLQATNLLLLAGRFEEARDRAKDI